MKLYGSYTSPFVRHCRIALMQWEFNFDFVETLPHDSTDTSANPPQREFDFDFVETDHAMSAKRSPTAKVPFLTDGGLTLTDSSSILKYIREKSGGAFLADLEDHETFAMANTVLDSAINLFQLENEGFGPDRIKYLSRQKNRIESGLDELNKRFAQQQSDHDIARDGTLRCACLLDWGLFRNRINIDQLDNLRALLAAANQVEVFTETAPPR